MKFNEYTHRNFLKTTGLGVISLGLPSFPLIQQTRKHKPDIILIMAGDPYTETLEKSPLRGNQDREIGTVRRKLQRVLDRMK